MDPSAPLSGPALLRRTVRRRGAATLRGLGLIVVWQVCEALVPVLIGVVIDQAVATGDLQRGLLWAAVLVVHFAVLSTGYRLGSRVLVGAIQRESHELRCEVAGHVLAPHGARTDRLGGEVLTLATGDADLVAQVVHQIASTGAAVVGLLVTAVALVVIDPVVALVVLAGVPVVALLTRRLGAPIEERTTARQEALGRATGVATDLVRGLRPLAGIGGQDAAVARYRRESRAAVGRSVDAARWEGLLIGVTDALAGVFLAAVALLAGLRALDGEMSIGELVAVVGLAQFLAEPLALVASLIAQVAQSRSAAGRIAGFLASPPLVLSGTTPGRPGGLALVEVRHGPLQGVTLHAEPGEVVAVVAEDPVDAAALVTLCHGEAAPERGAVTLGGVRLVDQALVDLRPRLLVADHHVDLFGGTLASNLDPAGATDPGRLRAVLVAAAADDVVDHAPGGLAEPVAAGGTSLSGGQAQRLALARALVADPEVLVLHDPTSAVDAVTEQRVADGLRTLRHDPSGAARATVLLTASPALLAQADRVVHLRAGRVVAVGTHRELSGHEAYRAAVLR